MAYAGGGYYDPTYGPQLTPRGRTPEQEAQVAFQKENERLQQIAELGPAPAGRDALVLARLREGASQSVASPTPVPAQAAGDLIHAPGLRYGVVGGSSPEALGERPPAPSPPARTDTTAMEDLQIPPGAQAAMAAPPPAPARAIRLPDGRILLTNQTQSASKVPYTGTPLEGRALYDAIKERGKATGVPTAADSGQGVTLPNGVASYGMRQNPEYQGAFSQLEPTDDQQAAMAIEDADRAGAVFASRGRLEEARQASQNAGMSAEQRAELTATARAPQLIAMRAIQEEYAQLQKARVAYEGLAQRMSTPGPDFVEPNQRQLALRMLENRLGLTGAEDRIRVLASVVGEQRVSPQGLTSLGQ